MMENFYWGLFTSTGSIDAYIEYKNSCDHIAATQNGDGHYKKEECDENFSRQWYRSEDYCGWGIE